MKRIIVVEKLEEEEGGATLYAFRFQDEEVSEYQKFYREFENDKKVKWDFDVIDQRLNKIVEFGAEDEHFRLEGKALKALPINTSKLRLYCYRINLGILILGNGGLKPRNPDPTKNKTSDFPDLLLHSETLRLVGKEIERQLDTNEIDLDGNELLYLQPFEIEIP